MTKTLEFYAIFTIKRLVIRIFLYFILPQVQKKIKRIVLTSVSLSAYMFAKNNLYLVFFPYMAPKNLTPSFLLRG